MISTAPIASTAINTGFGAALPLAGPALAAGQGIYNGIKTAPHNLANYVVQNIQNPFNDRISEAASLAGTDPERARQILEDGYNTYLQDLTAYEQSNISGGMTRSLNGASDVVKQSLSTPALWDTVGWLSKQLGLSLSQPGQPMTRVETQAPAQDTGINDFNSFYNSYVQGDGNPALVGSNITVPTLAGTIGNILQNIGGIGSTGLPGLPTGTAPTANPPVNPSGSIFDSLLPAILLGTSVGANIYSGNANADAAREAAKLQSDATKYAADLSNTTANRALDLNKSIYDQNLANAKPWLDTGTAAINDLGSRLGIAGDPNAANYGSLAKPFGEQFSFTADDLLKDPGYQTRLDAAQQAMERAASSKGMLFTPGTQARIDQKIGEGAANEFGVAHDRQLNEFMNRYNIFNNDQNTMFNRLSGVAGTGQVAGGQVQNAGNQYGSNVINTATGATRDINELNTTGQNSLAQGLVNSTRYGTTGVTNSIDDITSYINELLRQRKATV